MSSTITLLFFGQIAEITGSSSLTTNLVNDTYTLEKQLLEQFPELSNHPYLIAVNEKRISQNTPLMANNTIAFLPPFSGG